MGVKISQVFVVWSRSLWVGRQVFLVFFKELLKMFWMMRTKLGTLVEIFKKEKLMSVSHVYSRKSSFNFKLFNYKQKLNNTRLDVSLSFHKELFYLLAPPSRERFFYFCSFSFVSLIEIFNEPFLFQNGWLSRAPPVDSSLLRRSRCVILPSRQSPSSP